MSLSWRVPAAASLRRQRGAWAVCLLLMTGAAACGRAEDPNLVAWRTRLAQEARLTDEELQRLRETVARQVEGHPVQVREGGGPARTLDAEATAALLEVLSLPAGVFDEGIRREATGTVRVLNGPGRSDNAEIEATQRLLVDTTTLLPRRYEFTYAVPGYGQEQTLDISVGP